MRESFLKIIIKQRLRSDIETLQPHQKCVLPDREPAAGMPVGSMKQKDKRLKKLDVFE